MEITFKSNINCDSCIKKVTPALNKELDIEHWEVDTADPDKKLTVKGDVSAERVQALLKEVGYDAQPISDQ